MTDDSSTGSSSDSATDDGVAKVAELMKDIKIAMLTTIDRDGKLVSRPMAVQEVEFDGDLWFIAADDQRKTDEIAADPRVNVSFGDASSWVSISGEASVLHDVAKAKELWNPMVGAWFPDGPESPGVALVKVHATGAEYWDTPGGRVATVISFAKAKLTGKPYDGGENERVDLT